MGEHLFASNSFTDFTVPCSLRLYMAERKFTRLFSKIKGRGTGFDDKISPNKIKNNKKKYPIWLAIAA